MLHSHDGRHLRSTRERPSQAREKAREKSLPRCQKTTRRGVPATLAEGDLEDNAGTADTATAALSEPASRAQQRPRLRPLTEETRRTYLSGEGEAATFIAPAPTRAREETHGSRRGFPQSAALFLPSLCAPVVDDGCDVSADTSARASAVEDA